MRATTFFINTAIICYNCSRYSIVRLKEGFRKISLVGVESEALAIVLVSCNDCIANGVYNSKTSWLPKYTVAQDYRQIIRHIGSILGITPNIVLSTKFSVTAFKLKFCMSVYNIGEIFNISCVDSPSIRVF
jgi:hypothetical protein